MVPPLRKATWQRLNTRLGRSTPFWNRPAQHFVFHLYLNIVPEKTYFKLIIVNASLFDSIHNQVILDSCILAMFTNSRSLSRKGWSHTMTFTYNGGPVPHLRCTNWDGDGQLLTTISCSNKTKQTNKQQQRFNFIYMYIMFKYCVPSFLLIWSSDATTS